MGNKSKIARRRYKVFENPGTALSSKENVAEKVYKTGNNEQVDISREQVETQVKKWKKEEKP